MCSLPRSDSEYEYCELLLGEKMREESAGRLYEQDGAFHDQLEMSV
jgi:hypothetical protein